MARSRGFSVLRIEPCPNCCAMAATCTPMPGAAVIWCSAALAYTSANSARETFAPTVFALAMLLPITSRLRAAALRPLMPCWKLIAGSFVGMSEGGSHGVLRLHAGGAQVEEGAAVVRLRDGSHGRGRERGGADRLAGGGGVDAHAPAALGCGAAVGQLAVPVEAARAGRRCAQLQRA